MTTSVHNPDNYMASLRQIIAQGRKRIGLLLGAGAPSSLKHPETGGPLIPAVEGLTSRVLEALRPEYEATLAGVAGDLDVRNIEAILSRVRSLSQVIGRTQVHGLDGNGHKELSEKICKQIGSIVDVRLPEQHTAYCSLTSWIGGTAREHPVEVFTTNYDLLFEQSMERAKVPYFDGFTGAGEPFFDPSSVASNDLPPRWVRIWKLHGSLGWAANGAGEIIRSGRRESSHLVFPEHLKYEQTQKAPYSALFDRLKAFLLTPDTILVASGFSFADAHISARIDECLAANKSASVFAFQYKSLANERHARSIASRRPNMSVYCPDGAMINCTGANWMTGDLPTRDWKPIRDTYWELSSDSRSTFFTLGDFQRLSSFFASTHSTMSNLPTTEENSSQAEAAP